MQPYNITVETEIENTERKSEAISDSSHHPWVEASGNWHQQGERAYKYFNEVLSCKTLSALQYEIVTIIQRLLARGYESITRAYMARPCEFRWKCFAR